MAERKATMRPKVYRAKARRVNVLGLGPNDSTTIRKKARKKEDCAAASVVCHRWNEAALDELWRSLLSLLPLFELLGPLDDTDLGCDLDPDVVLTAESWDIFKSYAARVRFLTYDDNREDDEDDMSISAGLIMRTLAVHSNDGILPNLRGFFEFRTDFFPEENVLLSTALNTFIETQPSLLELKLPSYCIQDQAIVSQVYRVPPLLLSFCGEMADLTKEMFRMALDALVRNGPSLQRIVLVLSGIGAPGETMRLADIKPLLQLSEVKDLKLCSDRQLHLEVQEIQKMGQAWTGLMSLILHSGSGPGIPLSYLNTFAASLPALERLAVTLNLSGEIPPSTSVPSRFKSLHKLLLLDAKLPVDGTPRIAEFLAMVCEPRVSVGISLDPLVLDDVLNGHWTWEVGASWKIREVQCWMDAFYRVQESILRMQKLGTRGLSMPSTIGVLTILYLWMSDCQTSSVAYPTSTIPPPHADINNSDREGEVKQTDCGFLDILALGCLWGPTGKREGSKYSNMKVESSAVHPFEAKGTYSLSQAPGKSMSVQTLRAEKRDKRVCAAAALVCRHWCNIALDELWRSLPSLLPLFKVLGPLVDEESGQDLHPDLVINAQSWDVFKSYATRVRCLTYEDDDTDMAISTELIMRALVAHPHRGILPNLQAFFRFETNFQPSDGAALTAALNTFLQNQSGLLELKFPRYELQDPATISEACQASPHLRTFCAEVLGFTKEMLRAGLNALGRRGDSLRCVWLSRSGTGFQEETIFLADIEPLLQLSIVEDIRLWFGCKLELEVRDIQHMEFLAVVCAPGINVQIAEYDLESDMILNDEGPFEDRWFCSGNKELRDRMDAFYRMQESMKRMG
ncbi:hypothetical protein M407DRAFT_234238 [Tulasnella calospora MUT 4182]|uniref:F-box domain-containing protein n=1 Tax=Tulasnella calospora MUT 4182 TaxID=1051891 RepID=A0A0C3QIN9_9AGAM|nr:hypothetical protein M407DRAFT_234238 [Tulasnella calospora MUT 4182]